MEKPLVSFCVPTFNRPDTLKTTLSSLLSQQADCLFEVIVSDNSENNENLRTIEVFKGHPALRYHKNYVNIGSAANFFQLPSMAKGQYVWLMGDDDGLTPGALARVVSLLKKEPRLGYMFVSRRFCNADLVSIPGDRIQPNTPDNDLVFKNGKELCAAFDGEMLGCLGFISSTVINKELWDESRSAVGEPLGNLSHLRVILHAIIDKPCAIVSGGHVLTRLAPTLESLHSDIWLDQATELWKTAERWGYNKKLCRNFIGQNFYDFAKMFVLDKAMGRRSGNLYSLAEQLECTDCIKVNLPWFVLSCFPRSVLRLLPLLKNWKSKIIGVLHR